MFLLGINISYFNQVRGKKRLSPLLSTLFPTHDGEDILVRTQMSSRLSYLRWRVRLINSRNPSSTVRLRYSAIARHNIESNSLIVRSRYRRQTFNYSSIYKVTSWCLSLSDIWSGRLGKGCDVHRNPSSAYLTKCQVSRG